MELKERVKHGLNIEGKTIPELCKEFDVSDEYTMMAIIAELEYSGDAILKSFDKIYREDGGAIYLSKYSRKNAS